MKNKYILYRTMIVLIFVISANTQVSAQSSSNNFRVDESAFSSGSGFSESDNFNAQGTAGDLGIGFAESTTYDANGGYLTQNNAYLEMTVQGVSVDLGTLDSGSTSNGSAQGGACNCSFTIRTYLSSQYLVYSLSDPPTSENGDILTAKTSQALPSSDPDIEEFGINLRDNSTPDIGLDPSNYPTNAFADGEAASGYEIVDQFKYSNGDVIARSQATVGNTATGQTDYTISYIAKNNAITPAGVYVMNHVLVVVPTY